MSELISCSRKGTSNLPHERITALGGLDDIGKPWLMELDLLVAMLKRGMHSWKVIHQGIEVNVVLAVTQNGHEYLKGENDDGQPECLLSLPDCPPRKKS